MQMAYIAQLSLARNVWKQVVAVMIGKEYLLKLTVVYSI